MLDQVQFIADPVTVNGYLLAFIGILLSALLSVIVYFLKIGITELRLTRDTVIKIVQQVADQERTCNITHTGLDITIKEHTQAINRHEVAIALLKKVI